MPKTPHKSPKRTRKDGGGTKQKSETTSAQYNSAAQTQGAAENQNFQDIQRDWPTAYYSWSDAGNVTAQTAGTNMTAGTSSPQDLTPMERWEYERLQQSPWNNVGGVGPAQEDKIKPGVTGDSTDAAGT